MGKPSIVKSNPPPPPSMKTITGKEHTEVPLPSQEGTKGVMQYALYVQESRGETQHADVRTARPWISWPTGRGRAPSGP